ncbi:hypothetical protein [Aquibacillus saliphilus]|uniref:hypothetical protein n=1 Tax=Aquibacillus saliphilus TaxID=1909422 RepID=UPI001CF00B28|nr:hypothetical protein [Aquibacillus saliphilus]
MKVYVVLYEKYTDKETDVLEVHTDEGEANRSVAIERALIEEYSNERFRDECWYQEKEVIS